MTVDTKNSYNLKRSLMENNGFDCEELIVKSSKQLFVLVLVMCWIPSACGEQKNIAKGKKYTLDPKPNYLHCTDPGDKAISGRKTVLLAGVESIQPILP